MRKIITIVLTIALIFAGNFSSIHAQTTNSINSLNFGNSSLPTSFTSYIEINDQIKGNALVSGKTLSIIGNDTFKITSNYNIKEYLITSDINGDGYNDVLLYIDSINGQDNLVLVSGMTNEIIFSKLYTHLNVKDSNVFNENTKILQMLEFDNLFYLIVNYEIIAIDKTGVEVFKYTDTNNVWKMLIDGEQLLFTTQEGFVKSINRITGKLNWKTSVGNTYQVKSPYGNVTVDAKMNAWDMVVVKERLFVTTEDGFLTEVNLNTGEFISEKDMEIISNNVLTTMLEGQRNWNSQGMYYDKTGITKPAFMGMKVKSLDDHRIIVTSYLGDYHNTSESAFDLAIPKIMVFDIETSEVTSTINLEQFNLNATNYLISNNGVEDTVIVPVNSEKDGLRINEYSLSSGQLLKQNVTKIIGVREKNERIYLESTVDGYMLQSYKNISVSMNKEFKNIKSSVDESVARLITTLNDGILIGYSTNNVVDKIRKISLTDQNNIIFETNLPEEYRNNSIGFESVSYDQGSNTFIAIVNTVDEKGNKKASNIIEINGDNGSIITNKNIVIDRGYDDKKQPYTTYLTGEKISYLNDINKDGYLEILLDNNIINGRDITLKSIYSNSIEAEGRSVSIGDVNNDGINDFIAFEATKMTIYLSNISGFDISYSKSNMVYNYNTALENANNAVVVGDLNRDGVNEIVINARNELGFQTYLVIDGKTLTNKFTLMSEGVNEWGTSFNFTQTDYNNDGNNDIIFTQDDTNVEIISGLDGSSIYKFSKQVYQYDIEYTPYKYDYIVPIKIEELDNSIKKISDYNSDGVNDYIYLQTKYLAGTNIQTTSVVIVSGSDFTTIQEQVIENSYIDSNGFTVDSKQGKLYYKFDGKTKSYSLTNLEPIATFALNIKNIIGINENSSYVEDEQGNMFIVDDSIDFHVDDVKINNKQGKFNITWTSEKAGIMSVYDQGNFVASTANNTVEFKVLDGDHTITLSYDDGNGKTTYSVIYANIMKTKSLQNFFKILFVPLVVLLVFIAKYPKYRLMKRAGVKRG